MFVLLESCDEGYGPGKVGGGGVCAGVSCVERNFHIGIESSETNRVFIGRKRVQYVWIDTWVDSESCLVFFCLSWPIFVLVLTNLLFLALLGCLFITENTGEVV